MKSKISFVCQECGYDSPEWLGKCPECGAWNSLKEIKSSKLKVQNSGERIKTDLSPKILSEIHYEQKERTSTGFSEMDTVLGGGIVNGSVILLAGDPGIGKSTLLLQLGLILGSKEYNVLYISGEESEEQIKLRATRFQKTFSPHFFVLSITDTDAIIDLITDKNPNLVIIDSIQTMESENLAGLSGSVGQIRYATSMFIRAAKTLSIPIILVGHVTKEGMVAGPMVLSHMVDVVLFFEGEKTTNTRFLRSLKNRFGPVDEVGIFTMEEKGIREVKDTEHIFLTEKAKDTPGSVLFTTLEGTRPFLVEIQSLVVYSKLPFPRRVVSGVDPKRVELLLAVLQKQIRLPVESYDVFVNVAGGLKITDPGVDLAICLSIYSSLKNVKLSSTVAIAEVGLLGELRTASSLDKRVKEAKKLGLTSIISTKEYQTLSDVIKSLAK